MNKLKYTFCTCIGLLLIACVEGKYEKMSDSELREKKRHCDSIPKKSAVFATGCENVRKELERRKKNKAKK